MTSTEQSQGEYAPESVFEPEHVGQAQGWGMGAYSGYAWHTRLQEEYVTSYAEAHQEKSPGSSKLREIHCWQCGELVLRTYSYQTAYTCKLCDCSGKLWEGEARPEFTRPGTMCPQYSIKGAVYVPYVDFGVPFTNTLMHSSPA